MEVTSPARNMHLKCGGLEGRQHARTWRLETGGSE